MKFSNKYIMLAIMIICSSNISAQRSRYPIKFWSLMDLGGAVGFESEYKLQDIKFNTFYEDELESSYIKGKILLNTESYFYHPNLVTLETEMEYNPGTKKDIYLVLPDRSDISTGERVRGTFYVFRSLPLNFTSTISYSHHFTNREYTTNLESFNTSYGASVSYRNKIAPLSISIQKDKLDEKEIGTGRNYLTNRLYFRANTDFEIDDIDKHRLTLSYDDNTRKYFSSFETSSIISSVSLNSNFVFDTTFTDILNSNITYSKNAGDFDYSRFQVNENFNIGLQSNFKFNGNYSYLDFSQKGITNKQFILVNRLEHRLYESLQTNISYEYQYSDQNVFDEISSIGGFGILYKKNLGNFGHLSLSYNYRKRNLTNDSKSEILTVANEEQVLRDDTIVLLNNPNINKESIIVKDEFGSLIYQEFIDYILIERGDFFEIQRLPGGLIADNTTIYIDYNAEGIQSYEYGISTGLFNGRISFFNSLIEFYFSQQEVNFDNIVGINENILKSISQRIFGSQIRYRNLTAGIEFDDYNSNIIPYESTRYFITLNKQFGTKLNTSITGNLKFIKLLAEDDEQEFHDVSGRLVYMFTNITKFNLEASYRLQRGRMQDLNLSILRSEIKTQYRSIKIALGIEGYNRRYVGEKRNYWGSFVRIEREF